MGIITRMHGWLNIRKNTVLFCQVLFLHTWRWPHEFSFILFMWCITLLICICWTPALLGFISMKFFFHPFTVSWCMSLRLKSVSCREHIVGSWFIFYPFSHSVFVIIITLELAWNIILASGVQHSDPTFIHLTMWSPWYVSDHLSANTGVKYNRID